MRDADVLTVRRALEAAANLSDAEPWHEAFDALGRLAAEARWAPREPGPFTKAAYQELVDASAAGNAEEQAALHADGREILGPDSFGGEDYPHPSPAALWEMTEPFPRPANCPACGHLVLDHTSGAVGSSGCSAEGCSCGHSYQSALDLARDRKALPDPEFDAVVRQTFGEPGQHVVVVPANSDRERTMGIRAACRMWAASLGELKRTDPVPTPEELIERTIALVDAKAAADESEGTRYHELQGVIAKLDAHRETIERLTREPKALAEAFVTARAAWFAGDKTDDSSTERWVAMDRARDAIAEWAAGLVPESLTETTESLTETLVASPAGEGDFDVPF